MQHPEVETFSHVPQDPHQPLLRNFIKGDCKDQATVGPLVTTKIVVSHC